MSWYLTVLKKYAVFSGRARRTEYWMFYLCNIVIGIILGIIEMILGLAPEAGGGGPLVTIYQLAVLIPALAVSVRRLHDTGRSGWWMLLVFIPILGWIALLIFMVLDSEPGSNKHGPNPKTA